VDSRVVEQPVSLAASLRGFTRRQWVAAAVAAGVIALVVGLPTDVIPNPVFGRPVAVTWWSPWVLAATAVLGGLLAATYVRPDSAGVVSAGVDPAGVSDVPAGASDVDERPGRLAGTAGLLGYVAIGCPVCNKLVVVALGTTGALNWFAPLQPILAVAAVVLMAVALRARLRSQVACRLR